MDININISSDINSDMILEGTSVRDYYWKQVIKEATKAAAEAVEEMGEELDGKVENAKPYIINATYSTETGKLSYDTSYSLSDIKTVHDNGRSLVLRVKNFNGTYLTVNFTQMSIMGAVVSFYGEVDDVYYEIRLNDFAIDIMPYVINITLDADGNITADENAAEIMSATKSDARITLKLYDEATKTTYYGHTVAKISENVYAWHMCLGNEYYQVTTEYVFNEETEIGSYVWKIEKVTLSASDAIDLADKTPTQNSKNLITSGAVYDAVEGITPFVFDVTLSDDLTTVTTETTYSDIQIAHSEGKQIYIRASHLGDTYSAPLGVVNSMLYGFELFVNTHRAYVLCEYDTENGNPEQWYIEAVNIVTQEDFNNHASRVRIDELEDSKQIRIYAPNDLKGDTGIYQAIELYDKGQVDAKIGDIDTALENIITKYGLGGDGV